MKTITKSDLNRGVDLKDIPIPVPKEDELLIKVEAVSICGSDIHMYEGISGYDWISLPLVLGHEFTGIVEKAGHQKNEGLIGQRVVINPYVPCKECDACLRGDTNLCDYQYSAMQKVPAKSLRYGFRENGGMAEYAVVKKENVLMLPDSCPMEIAAMLEAIGISIHAIERSTVQVGDSVAIIGPGPIGLALVSILSNYGLKNLIVTGLKQDKKRLEIAKELGATAVLYADQEDEIKEIEKITNGKGVDLAFEISGFHGSMKQGIRMLRKGGELLLVGITGNESILPTNEIVRGEIVVKGVYGVTKKTLERAISLASSGKFNFSRLISHILPLEEAVKGFEFGIKKEAIKVILKP